MDRELIIPSSNVFAASLAWLQGTMLGTVATTIEVLADACVGFLLLSGRIDLRRAGQVAFGCFILFGASGIASDIMSAMAVVRSVPEAETPAPPPPPSFYAPAAAPQPPKAVPYDPYAGAAMPR